MKRLFVMALALLLLAGCTMAAGPQSKKEETEMPENAVQVSANASISQKQDQLAALEEIDARLLEGIKAKGVIVDEMENPDAWIEAVQPVYEDFAQIIGWDLINKVKEVAAAAS